MQILTEFVTFMTLSSVFVWIGMLTTLLFDRKPDFVLFVFTMFMWPILLRRFIAELVFRTAEWP